MAIGPANFHDVGLLDIAHPNWYAEVVAGKITFIISYVENALVAAHGHGDARPDSTAVALDALRPNLHPIPPVAAVVAEKHGRRVLVDNHHVDVAVIVEIAEGHAAPGTFG